MLNKWLRQADRTKGVGTTLWVYLWWGLLIRGLLLAALATLLLVEGNFLAEWLFSWRITPSIYDDIEEYTLISYIALGVFLAVGICLRWTILQRMKGMQAKEDKGNGSD